MAITSNQKVKECHWLPCSIASDCVAPIDGYFHPRALDVAGRQYERTTTVESKEDEIGREGDLGGRNIQAAAFRGKELLSCSQCELPSQIAGSVIALNRPSNSESAPSIKVRETFDVVTEWEHKWDENELANNAVSQSSASKSIELLRIIRSVSI